MENDGLEELIAAGIDPATAMAATEDEPAGDSEPSSGEPSSPSQGVDQIDGNGVIAAVKRLYQLLFGHSVSP